MEREFEIIEGYQHYLDSDYNPIYFHKGRRLGYWLVRDYLTDKDLDHVSSFTENNKHRYADLGSVLFTLCKFVSTLPDAKKKWIKQEELSKNHDTEFEQYVDLLNRFQKDLVLIMASHISGNEKDRYELKDFQNNQRILWESWDPFDITMDFVYDDIIKRQRREIRKNAVQGVPKEKRAEYLKNLSRVHKFVNLLFSMQTKDEVLERLYHRFCGGYTTTGSFLEPLRHFSFTRLYKYMKKALDSSEGIRGMNGLRAESFIQFCLVSHLLYDGLFPIDYQGLALHSVEWKKLSVAGIVAGEYIYLPWDTHLKRFFGIYAKSNSESDLEHCANVFSVRTDPMVGRYTNDFICMLGQIFDRGEGNSINFAVTVLDELMTKDPQYREIVAKWLGKYENNEEIREKLNVLDKD